MAAWPVIPPPANVARMLVKEFVSQVLDGSMTVSKDAEAMINARIAQIDHLISLQLNEVMHHPSLQKLESTWRGLRYMLDQSETGEGLKIKIINASKKDLSRDLQRTGIRPERHVQKGLRRGVRHLRRRPVRRSPGRLRVLQVPGRHRTAREDFQCRSRGPRAVSHCGRARDVQSR